MNDVKPRKGGSDKGMMRSISEIGVFGVHHEYVNLSFIVHRVGDVDVIPPCSFIIVRIDPQYDMREEQHGHILIQIQPMLIHHVYYI